MSRYRRSVTVITAAAALTLAAVTTIAACDADPAADGQSDLRTGALLYGSDGIMQDDFAAELVDRTVLAGMKGTAPLNPLPTDFTNRLREIDPSLDEFVFAGETYDAVVIGAVAAELAGTPDPEVVRNYINGVTTGGERCLTVAECLELARAGEQLEYRGMSLRRGGFTDLGEPSTASYATQHFGPDGFIDPGKTEFVGAGDPTATTEAESPEPGARPGGPDDVEPLTFGGLLPETGALSYAYPPMVAGARLAVEDINGAGGVFGVDVEWIDGDDGTLDADLARQTLASHIEAGVHVIIGAAASATTEAVLPDAVSAQRILFSPSSTRADLSAVADDGYFFRTAPSDDLQGAALADIVLRDGSERIVIVSQDEPYAQGLKANVSDALQRFGVPGSDVTDVTYQPPEADGLPIPGVDAVVEQVIAAQPDAVLVLGFGEASRLIQAMIDAGLPLES
jgi:ABC-type branched-subunit amino acid transport system substrate-binding protein